MKKLNVGGTEKKKGAIPEAHSTGNKTERKTDKRLRMRGENERVEQKQSKNSPL